VKIWDKNGSRAFLDSCGLYGRREGDLGPVYGFQWRHFGAKYADCDTYYAGQGVDQLQQMIDTIKNNPTDRRILMSAWNPEDLTQMALPPCHLLCQMFVNVREQTLSCSMYQRSCDLGLGVPFNIASYALLTYMVAHVCGLGVGELIVNLGDTHVYLNHLGALAEMISRDPRPFPVLRILRSVQDIDEFTAADFCVEHYDPHPSVEMEMAV
jgi:thymidylate synthase